MYGLVWVAIAAAAALVRRRPRLLLGVIAAVAAAELSADVIKVLVQRHRPFEHQLGPMARGYSFPSGHAATAFAGATMLAASLPRYRAPLLLLAALIALSRLYNGVHYPTDVIVGAALGAAIALLLRAATRRRSRRGSRAG